MAIERNLIVPKLFDVDQAGVEQVLSINIGKATDLCTAGVNHPFHDWPRRFDIVGRKTNCSNDKQHEADLW